MVDPFFAVWRASAGARRLGIARLRQHLLPATETALADAFADACARVDKELSSGLGDTLSTKAAGRSQQLVDLAMVMMTAAYSGLADDFARACVQSDPDGLSVDATGTDAARFLSELSIALLEIVTRRARSVDSPLANLANQVAVDGVSRRLDLLFEATTGTSSTKSLNSSGPTTPMLHGTNTLRLVDPRYRGRSEVVARLAVHIASADNTCPIVSLVGMAGAGKSWLADVLASELAATFDRAVRVTLRTNDSEPEHLLRTAVRHAGGDPEVADLLLEIVRIANENGLLIVIDNARPAFDLSWLKSLPAGCAVITTSREPVTDAATHVERLYDVDTDDAIAILRARAPAQHDDVEALSAIADRCGRLPLALGIVGSFAHRRPDVSWSMVHSRIVATSPMRFLDGVAFADERIRDAFSFSYVELEITEALLFRALGCLEIDIMFEDLASAAVPDVDSASILLAFDGLVDAALLEPLGAGEFTMHDLLREFGRSLEIEVGGHESVVAYNDRVLAHQLSEARTVVSRRRRPLSDRQ